MPSSESTDQQSLVPPLGDADSVIDLTEVTGNEPAAVLLVDLSTRTIVYANLVAEHLAPGVGLPVDLDTWSDTAALRDVDGGELSDSRHPLSTVAASMPVLGQAISAGRDTELGDTREPLWVVALPLTGAPQLENHALVVFLRLADRQRAQDAADAVRTRADLRERAILATGMSFTMADARAENMPLIWVNPAFTETTGYSFDEAVGSNCRFLQGRGTDPVAHVRMREALDAGEPISITLLNYRKNGSAFWNQVSLSPIHSAKGELTHYVGIQTDVTGRVQADRERDQAMEAERVARHDAERAQQAAERAQREAEHSQKQLSLLAEATSQLASTLDVRESLERLSSLVVPLLADWVIIASLEQNGGVRDVVVCHKDGHREAVDAYTEYLQAGFTADSIVQRIIDGEPASIINHYDNEHIKAVRSRWTVDPRASEVSNRLGVHSAMFVPLPGRNTVDGVMIFLRGKDSLPYDGQELAVADDLGRRAGLILDNARLYQSEHRIAETLQRSLLPDVPAIAGVSAAARYRASESGAAVGGDFYELIPLRDHRVGLAIGDVVGHDVFAAAAMGHLRGLLRACAWDGFSFGADASPDASDSRRSGEALHRDPAAVLDRVDELMQGLAIPTMASVAYASFEPRSDGWLMRHSSAGHPPLMVRHPDGTTRVLDDVSGLLLGVQRDQRPSAHQLLPVGSMVIAYTDGLVERRGEPLGDGLERLRKAISKGPDTPEALCDYLLDAFDNAGSDDVALLVLRLDPTDVSLEMTA